MPGSARNSLAELLTEAAQPNIYRINAFRILELTVDCGEMDISRRMRMIEITAKTGAPVQPGQGRALPMETPPDHYAYLDATQRLRAPEQRFIDEFFWFWPHDLGNGKNDEALEMLKQNDIEQAVEIWTNFANNYSVDNVSVHNLAVLSHASALDLETVGAAQGLNESQLKKLDVYWRQTFKRWNNLMTQDGFWKRLGARVRDFGDPRLDSATVDALHDALPLGLLLVNARLAVQSAERNDEVGVARHLRTMKLADFGEEQTNNALVVALEPARKRINNFCKTAESQTETDPVHANEAALNLLEQCRQPLQILDRLLPASAPAREATHDEVALRGMACLNIYAGRTDDWRGAMNIMEKFIPVASSPSTCMSLDDFSKTLRSNAESGNDWCGEGYYDLPEHILTPLEEARNHFRGRVWDKAIAILENLLYSKTTPIENEYKPLVRKPLATCMNLAGNDRVKDAIKILDEPRQMMIDVQNRMGKADIDWTMTYLAAQDGTAQSIAQTGSMVCLACGTRIYQRWYTATVNNVKIIICESCNIKDDRQMSYRRQNVSKAIVSFYDDLLYAQDLDPTNKSITENMATARDLAKTLNASLPTRTSHKGAQGGQPVPPVKKQGPGDNKTSIPPSQGKPAPVMRHFLAYITDILLFFLIVGVVVGILGNQTGNSSFAWLAIYIASAYYPFWYLLFRRTPGEKVTGSRVVDKDGNKITAGRAIARSILYIILYLLGGATVLLYLALLVPLFNKNHKSLPDYILGTCLVMA